MVGKLTFLAAFLSLLGPGTLNAGSSKPSVILISLDTVSAGHLDLYGYNRKTMPFLTRLAKTGVVFDNHLSAGAYTLPSHMTMFTGMSPLTHQIEIDEPNRIITTRKLAPSIKTITEYFKQNGYQTYWVAPITDPHLDLESGFGRGFDFFQKPLVETVLPSSVLIPELKRLLRKANSRPSFFFLHSYIAHDPYKPMPPFLEMFGKGQTARPKETAAQVAVNSTRLFFDSKNSWSSNRNEWISQFNYPSAEGIERMRTLYDGGLRTLDERLEDLFRVLKDEKLLDSTIVVLTSDHGEAFGEHGQFQHSIPFRDVLHVPLIILKKGLKPHRVREVTYGPDLMPTILELAGIKPHSNVEGQSLVPLMNGSRFIRKAKFQYARGITSRTIFDSRWQLVKWEDRRIELFDLQKDPAGMIDVAAQNSEVAGRLQSELTVLEASRPQPHLKAAVKKPYKVYWFIPENVPVEQGSFNLFKAAQAGDLPSFRFMMDDGIFGYSSGAPTLTELNRVLGSAKQPILETPKNARTFGGDWSVFMDDERLDFAEALDSASPRVTIYRLKTPDFTREKNVLEIYRGFDRLVSEGLRRADGDTVIIFSSQVPGGGKAPFFAWGPSVYRGKKLSKPVGAADQLSFGLRLTGHKPSAFIADPNLAAAVY